MSYHVITGLTMALEVETENRLLKNTNINLVTKFLRNN